MSKDEPFGHRNRELPVSGGIRALIFDMDGVIVDSEPLHERAFLSVFAELGYRESHGVCFADYYGRSDQAVWRDFLSRHRPEISAEVLAERKRDRFLHLLREEEPLFDGLLELLERLRGRIPLAIASGSSHAIIRGVLSLRGLGDYFSVVVSAQDVGAEKPAPDIFLEAARLLRVDPAHCAVVEDSVAGVQGARAAGMTTIAITNSFPARDLSQAHHVVDRYEDIQRLVLLARIQ